MAGFDNAIDCTQRQRSFVQSLLRFAQRKIKNRYSLDFKYRWQKDDSYYIKVDGPLRDIQSSITDLIDLLPAYADGLTSKLGSQERDRLVNRTLSKYGEGVSGITWFVHAFLDEHPVVGTPNSFHFDVGGATHLKGKAKDFTAVLVQYHQGRISASRLVEHSHTFAELLLKNVDPDLSSGSFSSLANHAKNEGYISEGRDELIDLKDMRKDAKHRGQNVPQDKIDELLPMLVGTYHQLLRKIRQSHAS